METNFRDRMLPIATSHIVILGIVAILILWLGQFVYNVYFHPLANIPGPKLFGGSEIPKIYHQIRGTINDKMFELHEQYGPVIRIAPCELTFTTSTAVNDIYGNRKGKKPLPPDPSLGLREKGFFGALSLLWVADHKEHARHRKVLAPSFSDSSLKAQESIITGYVSLLMQRFHERAGQSIDMWAWFNYATFDIIGDLTFGEPFGCVRDAKFHPWISFIFSNLSMMMYAQIMSRMGYLGYLIESLVPKRLKKQMVAHVKSTRDKVDRRRVRDTDRPDFITGILRYVDQPGGISSNELYADSQIFLMAGSETSATLLAVAVYYLLKNPPTMIRLQNELRSKFTTERDIVFSSVSKLSFLGAVINESLRIHPPLPAGINRRVPSGGATVDGIFLPEGTILQVPHWATYHSSANFAEPWSFSPERWLEDTDDKFAGDNREVFHPFSFGPRNCMGRSLAYMETRMILSRLIWNFDLELMLESSDWNKQKVFLLYEKRPLNVKLTPVPRDQASEMTGAHNENKNVDESLNHESVASIIPI